jgi:benzoyl-CoA reductase/2-hydroxyglutaryl-CoA dehydratase subunit BcrC/BadD/HgdB
MIYQFKLTQNDNALTGKDIYKTIAEGLKYHTESALITDLHKLLNELEYDTYKSMKIWLFHNGVLIGQLKPQAYEFKHPTILKGY